MLFTLTLQFSRALSSSFVTSKPGWMARDPAVTAVTVFWTVVNVEVSMTDSRHFRPFLYILRKPRTKGYSTWGTQLSELLRRNAHSSSAAYTLVSTMTWIRPSEAASEAERKGPYKVKAAVRQAYQLAGWYTQKRILGAEHCCFRVKVGVWCVDFTEKRLGGRQ